MVVHRFKLEIGVPEATSCALCIVLDCGTSVRTETLVRDGAFDEHTAGRFGLERALLATYVLAVFLTGSERRRSLSFPAGLPQLQNSSGRISSLIIMRCLG